MPFSTNTKLNEFGHAQVLRDIEYLYMYLSGDEARYVNQGVEDDGITGESLDRRIARLGGGGGGDEIVVPTLHRIRVTASANNKDLGYGSLRGAKYGAAITTGSPLASAYDPLSETAITDDGIAYGLDLNTNSACLIFNSEVDSGGVVAGDILTFDLPMDCTFLAYRQIDLPVSGGATVPAWEGYWA